MSEQRTAPAACAQSTKEGAGITATLYCAIAGILALVSSAEAVSLSGPVDFEMVRKAIETREPVEIASPGGNMIFSMAIAQTFKERGIAVRVVGWCASGCAMIAIGSGNCTVARSGRLMLHGPKLPVAANVTDFARVLERSRTQWKNWMQEAGVPSDLIEATFQAFRQEYELSPYAMKRVGCRLE
jgi:ATP-dependent protease ClpP protease subunit